MTSEAKTHPGSLSKQQYGETSKILRQILSYSNPKYG